MLTEKDYCDCDTCVSLYELGLTFEDASLSFERNILTNRYEEIPRPSLYEAQKWLREEKDMNVYVKAFNGEGWYYIIQNYKGARIYPPLTRLIVLCHSYEEALSEGIKEGIKKLQELYKSRRQKLEMENTEFDYGHNVNHKEIN